VDGVGGLRAADEPAAEAPGPRRAAEPTHGMLPGYGLAEPDPTDAVRLPRSTFHGFVALEAVDGFALERSRQYFWNRALDTPHTLLAY
jgi:hypothetical protein